MPHIILYQPEIPQNTGNIVRTCSVTGSGLYLVKPLGFSTSSRQLKRAGLDYWEGVDVQFIENLEIFLKETPYPFYFFSSHAQKSYTEISFTSHDLLIFGSERGGLSPIFHQQYPDLFYTIPMAENARCLNLANSVAIVLYESLRQQNFKFPSAGKR